MSDPFLTAILERQPPPHLYDFTDQGTPPPADLDDLSPKLQPLSLPTFTTPAFHPSPHTLTPHTIPDFNNVGSTFTVLADDDYIPPDAPPDLTLPSTSAPPPGPSLLPDPPAASTPLASHLVTATPDAAPYSPLTPAVAKIKLSPTMTKKHTPATRRGRTARDRHSSRPQLPLEWRDILLWNDFNPAPDDIPDSVVDALFDTVQRKNREMAMMEKLALREKLKEAASEQLGSPAEISSRREAKVSRRYQQVLREGCEAQLKLVLRRLAALWRDNRQFNQYNLDRDSKRHRPY